MLVCTKDESKRSFKEAIFEPLSPSGGLYCFENITPIMRDLSHLSYKQMALEIIRHLDLGVDDEVFERALAAYESFDDPSAPVFLRQLNDNTYLNELYHGPTRAFKDMALSPFGSLFYQLSNKQRKYLVMCATSGDTGPATLNAFAGYDNIKVLCIYPHGKTSLIQERQMASVNAKNVKVLAITEDFDAAQRTLKAILNDTVLKTRLEQKGYTISAANSVNIGRILFQIIYHYYAASIVSAKHHTSVDVVVPSGNFGNALACFYAKKLGAKIGKIIIASNANNVLYDFIKTGVYDISFRHLELTYSPAMDILVSSNVERLLFELFGYARTAQLQESLSAHKRFELDASELEMVREYFDASWCDDERTLDLLSATAPQAIIDPHTATAMHALVQLRRSSQSAQPVIICSTAEWTKFVPSMAKALYGMHGDEQRDLERIASEYGLSIHENISKLFKTDERYDTLVATDDIARTLEEWL